jgi:hypothetical protein
MSEQWYRLSVVMDDDFKTFFANASDFNGVDSYDLQKGRRIDAWNRGSCLLSTSSRFDGPLTDVISESPNLLAFSERLSRSLKHANVAAEDIQYLPIKIYRSTGEMIEGYSLINVLARLEALDRERCFMLRENLEENDPQTGKPDVEGIGKPALRSHVITGHDMIRLTEFFPPIFVSQRFADVFRSGGFTGAAFQLIPTN